jgi:hypothetical protein
MEIKPPTPEMDAARFKRIEKQRMEGPLTLWNGTQVPYDELLSITDGSLGALVIPRKYYSSFSILFEESYKQGQHIAARGPFMHWFQTDFSVLFRKDGTLHKPGEAMDKEAMVKEAMGAFLQREIVHYYHIWTAIMKEQGKSSVVYDDSVLGKAIKVLGINVIPIVQHPEWRSRMDMEKAQ